MHVSSADTVDAVRRELGNERFDEIIVAAPPERLGRFFGVDDTHKLQRAFDVPLVSLIDPHGHRLRSDDFDSTGPIHPR